MNSTTTSLSGSNTCPPGMVLTFHITLNGSPVWTVNFSLMPMISATVPTFKVTGAREHFQKWTPRTSS